jgi:DNA-binding NarL/FixJ family response regulator
MNLLWVENHAPFVRVAGRQFLAAHRLTVVPTLAAARAALGGACFDVVLVDYDLDDGKGEELVRELAGVAGRPAVVAVSAHAAGNRALLEAGADAVCGKMEFARIAAVIEGLVRG